MTDPDWIQFLQANTVRDRVNFWRKDTRDFKLDPGAYVYFKPQLSHVVVGRGRFHQYGVRRVDDAWKTYGRGNGVISLDHLLERAGKVLKISDPSIARDRFWTVEVMPIRAASLSGDTEPDTRFAATVHTRARIRAARSLWPRAVARAPRA